VEVGWGDEQFYRANEVNAELALRALLWPTESVLQVVVFDTHPESHFWTSEVAKIVLPRVGYETLLSFVVNSFATTDGRLGPALGPSLYGTGGFFRARGSFHAFYTCNTWVADAVDRSGFPWPAERTLTAGSLTARLGRAEMDSSGCYRIKR
jgi:uncharacterized protein (TIGR02117 family)